MSSISVLLKQTRTSNFCELCYKKVYLSYNRKIVNAILIILIS